MNLQLGSHLTLTQFEALGFYIADKPSAKLDHKPLYFFAFHLKNPSAPLPPLDLMVPAVKQALEDHNQVPGAPKLHLYYLDARGWGLLSTPADYQETRVLTMAGNLVKAEPVDQLILRRTYEANGLQGLKVRTTEERKDVFFTIEKFLGSCTLGWGGLFHGQSAEERQRIFDSFYPFKTGFFHPGERLSNLVFRCRLGVPGPQEIEYFKELTLNIEEATLEAALKIP